jgi:polyhydroxyalkanoate synthase subunit PhaC
MDAIEKATGEKSVNIMAYCLGGTLNRHHAGMAACKKNSSRV